MYKYLMGRKKDEVPRLTSVVPSDRTRDNGHKLNHMKVKLNTRRLFFTVRMVKHWQRLPRKVESPSMEICKPQLNRVLGSCLQVTLL